MTDSSEADLVLDCDLDAPPAKVWRALTLPAFREQWLPPGDLADPQGETLVEGEAVRYRLREADPPHSESEVTFRITESETGGTRLRILHDLTDPRFTRLKAANSNAPPLMRAA